MYLIYLLMILCLITHVKLCVSNNIIFTGDFMLNDTWDAMCI